METNIELHNSTDADRARLLAERAAQARRDGLDQQAFDYYAESLALYRNLGDRPNILRLLIRISYLSGWADFRDGLDMFTRRQQIADEALPLAREIGDNRLLAEALCAFSATVFGEGAAAMLEESIALSTASEDTAMLAQALARLANTMGLLRNYKRANALNKQALGLYQRSGDRAGEANVLASMAIRARKDRKRALLERALELQRALGAKKRIVELLMRLDGSCGPEEMDWREAINREALELCRQFDSPIWEAACLDRLAEISRQRGDEAEALALEAESRRTYQPPEIDPALEDALKEAMASGDAEKVTEALKKLAGG